VTLKAGLKLLKRLPLLKRNLILKSAPKAAMVVNLPLPEEKRKGR